jgi:probable HAF family extracellular repeat protein
VHRSITLEPRAGKRIGATAAAIALLSLGLPLTGAGPAAAASPSRYTVTDLGALAANALAINNAGVVVGYTSTPAGQHAFRWSNGVLTDLGTLPGGGNSTANAINDAGQIAGTSDRTSGGYGYPVKWSASGTITDLGGPVTNRLGVANGIDQHGRVVGGQRPADSEGSPLAMVYEPNGTSSYLASPPELLSAATGINQLGHIIANPGYLWHDGQLTRMPGLRYFDGDATSVYAINVRDQIVGSAPIGDGVSHAVLWPAPEVVEHGLPIGIDIGTVDNIANSAGKAINAANQVVGTADPMCQPCVPALAWVWQPGGTITALDTLIPPGSGWQLQQANGINDRGQIVGRGLLNGQYHAYLLNPRFQASVNFQPASAAVPTGNVPDSGAVYGPRPGGRTYGWSADDTAFTRDRNASAAPDQRYDTLIHSQHPNSANVWEIAVPNGTYLVHVVAGDPDYTDSVYQFAVEGTLILAGTPTSTSRYVEASRTVTVTDGRITVSNAPGGRNNKLDYIEVIGL